MMFRGRQQGDWVLILLGLLCVTHLGLAEVIINEVHYHPANTLDRHEFIELFNSGEAPVDLSSWQFEDGVSFEFAQGVSIEAGGYLVVAVDPEVMRRDFGVNCVGPFDGKLSNEGELVRLVDGDGELVDRLAYGIGFPWPTNAAGGGSSIELMHPGLENHRASAWRSSGFGDSMSLFQSMHRLEVDDSSTYSPTPGKANSSFRSVPPPSVASVKHTPTRPSSQDRPIIEVSLPSGEQNREVSLLVQTVVPGQYVPAYFPLQISVLRSDPTRPRQSNPAFGAASSWATVAMKDDGVAPDRIRGDGVYTVALARSIHRSLVRYRVRIQDRDAPENETTVPFPDDPALNFAFFVYDGIPAYPARAGYGDDVGQERIHSEATMRSVHTYHLLTREPDLMTSHGYNHLLRIKASLIESRKTFNWEGTLVYGDSVYDHIRYRLRQRNDRYNHGFGGKRAFRIRFHRAHRFQAQQDDGTDYELPWRTLNLSKMIDGKQNQTFGLPEAMNSWLWNLVDIPAPRTHYAQLRVIDRFVETATGADGHYHGDFWGLFLAFEDYDSRFIRSHGMPDGNLYLLKSNIFDGNQLKLHQGQGMVPGDDDFQNIRHRLRPERDLDWLHSHVDFEHWYRYHTVNEAVRHFDYLPQDRFQKNRAWFFDPTEGGDFGRLWVLPWDSDTSWGPNWGVGLDYPKNAIFGGDGKPGLKTGYRNFMREFRDLIWTREVIERKLDALASHIGSIAEADRDRWIEAPFGRPIPYGSLADKVADMKAFAFEGWIPELETMGPVVGEGGRAKHLEELAGAEGEASLTPQRPELRYHGPEGFPADQLDFVFSTPPNSTPTVESTAFRWRVAEIDGAPSSPGGTDNFPALEWPANWVSEESELNRSPFRVPSGLVQIGHTYRLRVQVKSRTGQWSRWSLPIEFQAGSHVALAPSRLRIAEIHYHPDRDDALEYLEIANAGTQGVWLGDLELKGGVRFDMEGREGRLLLPNERVLVVQSPNAFARVFPQLQSKVLGGYDGRLSNGGEEIQLFLDGLLVQVMTYDDEWYPESDGGGWSLVANLEQGADLDWNVAAAWRLAESRYGTPGGLSSPDDRDSDRVPDLWELEQGLDPFNASDVGQYSEVLGTTWFDRWSRTPMNGPTSESVRIEAVLIQGQLQLQARVQEWSELVKRHWWRQVRLEQRVTMNGEWQPLTTWEEVEDQVSPVSVELDGNVTELFFRATLVVEPRP